MSPRQIRQEAVRRFAEQPEVCFQKHIQNVWGEVNPRSTARLEYTIVKRVSNKRATALIRRYEWLEKMAEGTIASYGLFYGEELLGVACFAKGASVEPLRSVNEDTDKVVILARGCCVPHAGRNAPSKLISGAVKLAHRDFGWTHFVGYADPDLMERGNVYRACSWTCIGVAEQGRKHTFRSPDGKRKLSSYSFNYRNEYKFYALGWDGKTPKYQFLESLGWTKIPESQKVRWLKVIKAKKMRKSNGPHCHDAIKCST